MGVAQIPQRSGFLQRSAFRITPERGGWVLESALEVPRPLDEVFAFFSDAANLSVLTPPFLQFHTLTAQPIHMAVGTLIDYRIRVRGLPVRWRTEIAVWEPPHRFVDDQLKGPYRRWHHEHKFTATAGGTLCEDRVSYSGLGGPLIHALFVRRDIETIFRYRIEKMRELFGDEPGTTGS